MKETLFLLGQGACIGATITFCIGLAFRKKTTAYLNTRRLVFDSKYRTYLEAMTASAIQCSVGNHFNVVENDTVLGYFLPALELHRFADQAASDICDRIAIVDGEI